MQRASARELAPRRAAVVAAVREVAPLRFVNGGGTGSVERTAAEPAVTEVAAGSGLYGPTLFDAYRALPPAAGGTVRAAGRAAAGRRHGDAARRRLPGLGRGRRATGCPAPVPAAGAAGSTGRRARARSRRRCVGPGAARWGRRHGVDAPRQGGRAVRAVRLAASGSGRRGGRRGADVSRRGRVFPVARSTALADAPGSGGLPEIARSHEQERGGEAQRARAPRQMKRISLRPEAKAAS